MGGQESRGLKTFGPGPRSGVLRAADGALVEIPAGWVHVPPGDAAVTRRIKAQGEAWLVEEARGNKRFGRGLWAPAATVEKVTRAVAAEKASPDYQRKLDAGRQRREREQADYVVEFTRHVLTFLAFAPTHRAVAERLARRVAEHATPVGSGTVARTERIPVAERAEAAVIAWMRHQTTAYDTMSIARVAGRRREVRRALAARSRELLDRYRRGLPAATECPLAMALASEPRPVEGARGRVPSVRHALRAAVATAGSRPDAEELDGDDDSDGGPDELHDADDPETDDPHEADDPREKAIMRADPTRTKTDDPHEADDPREDEVTQGDPGPAGGLPPLREALPRPTGTAPMGRAKASPSVRVGSSRPASGRQTSGEAEGADDARRARMEAVRARMQRGRKS